MNDLAVASPKCKQDILMASHGFADMMNLIYYSVVVAVGFHGESYQRLLESGEHVPGDWNFTRLHFAIVLPIGFHAQPLTRFVRLLFDPVAYFTPGTQGVISLNDVCNHVRQL